MQMGPAVVLDTLPCLHLGLHLVFGYWQHAFVLAKTG